MEFHKLQEADRDTFLEMAREFYHSDAVLKPVPDSYFENTLKECLRSDEYLLCYILEWEENAAGYALLSKSYSPEAGGPVLWVEEIYIRPAFRAHRIGSDFLAALCQNPPAGVRRIRLEVEAENTRAIALYKRLGFRFLPYLQMVLDKE